MGIRLLKKSDVAKAQSVEQRTAVEEGLKLARSVDNLREIRAEEERSLADFRIKTVSNIHEEIKTYSEKLENLKYEVKIYEDRREAALKPLDDEWLRCADKEAELGEREEGINDRESAVGERESAVEVADNEFKGRAEAIKRAEVVIEQQARESDQRVEDTKKSLIEAQDIVTVAKRLRRNVEEELTHREAQVASREKRATLQETENQTNRRALDDEWRLLNDRALMVERNKKRINNQ